MLAIKGGTLLTAATGLPARIEDGVVLVDAGKIVAVGGPDLTVPAGAKIMDATGCVITPGFIDAHSHIGIYEDGIGWEGEDANEATDPNTAEVRALDGINPADTAYAEALEGGVTTVQVAPGSANIIGGEILVMKCRGTVVDDMVIRRPSGLKAALGENPKRVYGAQRKLPGTRMGSAAVMRAALTKARDYMRKQEAAADKPDKAVDRDLRLEMVCRVLRREIPLRVHAHRADDILTAIRIAEEFDIEISLEHATEGHKIAQLIAAKGIPCAVGPSLYQRSKLETKDRSVKTAGVLANAGVKVALICDHPIVPQQWLRIAAGVCIREGMTEADALLACTRNPAEMCGVADRLGSLAPGKDADIVVWDGDPFEYLTKTRCVLIDGEVAHCAPEAVSAAAGATGCRCGGHSGRCC